MNEVRTRGGEKEREMEERLGCWSEAFGEINKAAYTKEEQAYLTRMIEYQRTLLIARP
jgi:hypothetical protein